MSPQLLSKPYEVWKLIEKGFTLRLSLVSRDWATKHLQAKNAIIREARNRGNSGYLNLAWIEMEIAEMNRRAEWAYKACCEIWEIQKSPRCREFYRAVFEWCLKAIFATRAACFQADLKTHQLRGRAAPNNGNSRIRRHLNREVQRLCSEWNTKLEIAWLDVEQEQSAAAREAQRNQVPAGPTASVALGSSVIKPK
jgi:hypothetical protein